MDTGSVSTRVTYRHMALAQEAMHVLVGGRNGARRLPHRVSASPGLRLLDLCLRIGEEELAGTRTMRAGEVLKARIAEVLEGAATQQANVGSLRLQYALAALHFVERTLGFTLLDSGRRRSHAGQRRVETEPRLVVSEDRRRTQNCGTYATPDFIAQAMVEDLISSLERDGAASADVLDLSLEAGHFPLTSTGLRPESLRLRFFGIDRDRTAVQMARRIMAFALEGQKRRGYAVHAATQDSLFDPLPAGWPRRFAAVIGNPPWKRRHPAVMQILRERYRPFLRGPDELYLAFMLRAHELLRPGGYLCYVVPSAFLFNRNAAPVRRLLLEHYHILNLRIYPQRSFIEVPCVIPVSFLARKQAGSCPERAATRIIYQKTELGGPDRPRGVCTVAATRLWRKLPGHVIHPVVRPDCAFLLAGLAGQKLRELGRLYLGLRLARAGARTPPCPFRAIQARDIRPFHVCLRGTRMYGTSEVRFDPAPDRRLILTEKVVFQELRYMTHRQRLVAAVAGPRTYPVSTASMFLPHIPHATHFFAALLNSALANAWYKLRDVSRSIKLACLREFPVICDRRAWERISVLAHACAGLRTAFHRRLPVCTVSSEHELLAQRFPLVYRRLRECQWKIDREVFELYNLPRTQRQVVLRLAAARVF